MRKCFVLEGVIAGFFASPRVVELNVHDDGTLSGSVSAHEEGEEEGNNDFDTFLLLYGTAIEDQQQSNAHSDVHTYNVRFQLTKRTDLPGLVYLIDVVGTLSSGSGLHGTWRFESDKGTGNARAFSLPIRQVEAEEQLAVVDTAQAYSLNPLTQGSYTFKGAAVGDNGFLYQATWKLELLADGVLEGSSTELDNAPQISRLEGSWSSTGIHCKLYYQVDTTMGVYIYDGEAHCAALRGRFVNPDSPESTRECGNFDFVLVEAARRWNHSDHKHYPQAFQEIVRLCLLASTQREANDELNVTTMPRIPSHLWSEVFAYCGFDWFPSTQ